MAGFVRRAARRLLYTGSTVALFAAASANAQTAPSADAPSAREAELEARLKLLEQAVGDLRAELAERRAAATGPAPAIATQPPVSSATGPVATAAPSTQAVNPQAASGGVAGRATANSVATGTASAAPSDGFRMGNTTVKLGGFVRLNVIGSRYSDGEVAVGGLGKEFFLSQQIPVGGGFSSEDLLFSARQTRLVFSTATPVNGIEAKTLIEFDFALAAAPVGAQRATNPYVPTFRRGFIEYGNLLVGQEWSTFQNLAVLPETTDFAGPLDGTVFNRQALIRYTVPLRPGLTLQVAAENPETQTALPTNAALVDTDDDRLPDVVARINWKSGLGDFVLASIARELRTDTLGTGDTAFGWGVSGSGKIPFGKRHDLRFMATYGQGIGRYLGLGYVPDAIFGGPGGQLERIDNFAGFAALKIGWTDRVRSTFMGSYQSADYPENVLVTGLANAKSYGGAANLFWSPAKSFDIGMEYRHAVRELLSGDSGALDRFELAFKYGF
ncbi:DcaP family trimeric outer membrane transporter [Sphingomonas sp. CFBP 13720]|uniref:DcaP family trimeric outer membrane transporter n=1 Tax=Sphingomonas sp. CFBP 13720 TaxID=2775302 RepID=UPI00201749F1|nr:DcaP family trimeric outer membrane transporter [Sphingomonas sp. CFBP 13720]